MADPATNGGGLDTGAALRRVGASLRSGDIALALGVVAILMVLLLPMPKLPLPQLTPKDLPPFIA